MNHRLLSQVRGHKTPIPHLPRDSHFKSLKVKVSLRQLNVHPSIFHKRLADKGLAVSSPQIPRCTGNGNLGRRASLHPHTATRTRHRWYVLDCGTRALPTRTHTREGGGMKHHATVSSFCSCFLWQAANIRQKR